MNDIYLRIRTLYPDLTDSHFQEHISLRDDGDGPYIERWDHPTLPRPTEQQLLAVEPKGPVPQSVTPAQGGVALIQAGLMAAVQAAADAPDTPAEVKWAWDKANAWEWGSPALVYLADKAGISSSQMADLFRAAALIKV